MTQSKYHLNFPVKTAVVVGAAVVGLLFSAAAPAIAGKKINRVKQFFGIRQNSPPPGSQGGSSASGYQPPSNANTRAHRQQTLPGPPAGGGANGRSQTSNSNNQGSRPQPVVRFRPPPGGANGRQQPRRQLRNAEGNILIRPQPGAPAISAAGAPLPRNARTGERFQLPQNNANAGRRPPGAQGVTPQNVRPRLQQALQRGNQVLNRGNQAGPANPSSRAARFGKIPGPPGGRPPVQYGRLPPSQ